MRPYQWEPAPKYRPPTLWQAVRELAPFWIPTLILAIADVIGL